MPVSPSLNSEVTQHNDEVMVTVDMIPGCEEAKISVDLVGPDSLSITCDREEGTTTNSEWRSFSVHRIIPLPDKVTTTGAKTTYKNGVLDIHLRRARSEQR